MFNICIHALACPRTFHPTPNTHTHTFCSKFYSDVIKNCMTKKPSQKWKQVGSTQIATSLSASPSSSSSGSFQAVNQFNDSSSDHSSENILSDLSAFTSNADKLGSVFGGPSTEHAAPKQQQRQQPQPSNPFLMTPAFGEIPKSTDSTKSMTSMTGKSYNINYDAFRDTFTTNEFSAIGQADVMPTMAQKPTISMDLFRDAAAAAFSEFGTANGKKHEFFNKMPEMVAQSGKVMHWWEHRWIRAVRDVFRDVWSFLLSIFLSKKKKKQIKNTRIT